MRFASLMSCVFRIFADFLGKWSCIFCLYLTKYFYVHVQSVAESSYQLVIKCKVTTTFGMSVFNETFCLWMVTLLNFWGALCSICVIGMWTHLPVPEQFYTEGIIVVMQWEIGSFKVGLYDVHEVTFSRSFCSFPFHLVWLCLQLKHSKQFCLQATKFETYCIQMKS